MNEAQRMDEVRNERVDQPVVVEGEKLGAGPTSDFPAFYPASRRLDFDAATRCLGTAGP